MPFKDLVIQMLCLKYMVWSESGNNFDSIISCLWSSNTSEDNFSAQNPKSGSACCLLGISDAHFWLISPYFYLLLHCVPSERRLLSYIQVCRTKLFVTLLPVMNPGQTEQLYEWLMFPVRYDLLPAHLELGITGHGRDNLNPLLFFFFLPRWKSD